MNPQGRQLYVDQLLTDIIIGYSNPMYIESEIAPLVRAGQRSGLIPALTQSQWFRDSATRRAPGTKSTGHGFGTDLTATYYAARYSFRYEITDDDRETAAASGVNWQLDQLAAKFTADKILMKREVNWSTQNFKSGVWGTDLSGTAGGGTDFTSWDDYGAGDPAQDIEAGKETIEGKIGTTGDVFVIGRQGFTKLKYHPALIDKIKHVQKGVLTEELIASLLELRKLLVGRAIYTTSAPGTAEGSVTYSRIWGKSGLLMQVAPAPSIFAPSASYTFWWPRAGAPAAPWYVKRMRNEEQEVDIVESNSYFDQKVVVANAGVFFGSLVG